MRGPFSGPLQKSRKKLRAYSSSYAYSATPVCAPPSLQFASFRISIDVRPAVASRCTAGAFDHPKIVLQVSAGS